MTNTNDVSKFNEAQSAIQNDEFSEVFDNAFSSVIGYEPIKMELRRIIDIMRNPKKYKDLGVSTPRGVLIDGEPGLGKTLIANCFIKASGRKAYVCRKDKPDGDFVKGIREIYEEAIQNAPSIVFLDDMDKFANEDEFHINADEFITIQSCIDQTKNTEVFTIATTNDLRCIPKSLTRVGRFDKNFTLTIPRGEDAEKIINHYISQKKFISSVDTKQIARILTGSSCAELETVINEAGIYAGFEGKTQIEMEDFIRATMRVVFNAPEMLSNGVKLRLKEISYHEAGHAVINEILEAESVNIVSVKKYDGEIGGVTSYYQPQDYFYSKKYMENRVISLLGGKASTEIVFGETDVGANNDIKRARKIVERFVDDYCTYGFDRFEYTDSHSNELMARKESLIFSEMERYYQIAKKILIQNREFLDKLAKELVEKETLINSDVQKIKNTCNIVEFSR